jgi:hypothetical protein
LILLINLQSLVPSLNAVAIDSLIVSLSISEVHLRTSSMRVSIVTERLEYRCFDLPVLSLVFFTCVFVSFCMVAVAVVGVIFNCGGGPQTVALRPLRRGSTVDADVVVKGPIAVVVVAAAVSNPIHNTTSKKKK